MLIILFSNALVTALSPASISVAAEKGAPLSPLLYSLFFETEINFGGEGGLYAEQIWNRDFEALGRGRVEASDVPDGELQDEFEAASRGHASNRTGPLDPNEPPAIPTDFRPWTSVGGAKLSIDNTTAPFPSNPNSLKIECPTGLPAGGAGVANPGYWGIAVASLTSFNLTLYAKSSAAGSTVRLTARLTEDGRRLAEAAVTAERGASATPLADGWVAYRAVLKPTALAGTAATFEIVLADDHQPTTFWLDGVSLVRADAVAGHLPPRTFHYLPSMPSAAFH